MKDRKTKIIKLFCLLVKRRITYLQCTDHISLSTNIFAKLNYNHKYFMAVGKRTINIIIKRKG